MLAWLPVNAVGTWLGADAGLLAVPLAVAIGLPVYLNSFAAIPFVSGLIGMGMSPATGLAFMLASSATGFPAIVAVWALVKPRAFALYIGFPVLGALIAGYTYTAVLAATVVGLHEMLRISSLRPIATPNLRIPHRIRLTIGPNDETPGCVQGTTEVHGLAGDPAHADEPPQRSTSTVPCGRCL
jgi:hypothetical protein